MALNHSFIDSLASPPFCDQHPVYCVTRHHVFFAAIGVLLGIQGSNPQVLPGASCWGKTCSTYPSTHWELQVRLGQNLLHIPVHSLGVTGTSGIGPAPHTRPLTGSYRYVWDRTCSTYPSTHWELQVRLGQNLLHIPVHSLGVTGTFGAEPAPHIRYSTWELQVRLGQNLLHIPVTLPGSYRYVWGRTCFTYLLLYLGVTGTSGARPAPHTRPLTGSDRQLGAPIPHGLLPAEAGLAPHTRLLSL